MLRRLLKLLMFVPMATEALPVSDCEIRSRGSCTYQACLHPPTPSYPRPTLELAPVSKSDSPSPLRIHWHGWTQDQGQPRHPDIDFAWTNPNLNPTLRDLRAFTEFYDFASAVCAPEPETILLPISRGHNDDHRAFFTSSRHLREYLESIRTGISTPPLRLSAHSGGGRILAGMVPFEGLSVERIQLFDAIYSAETSESLLKWLTEPHRSQRTLEVHSVTAPTAGPAQKMRLNRGPLTRETPTVRLERTPESVLRVEVDLSGILDHYSVVPERFARPVARGRNLLIIGDSHSAGTFGQTLDGLFRKDSTNQVRTVASCGSIIHWWYHGQPTTCGFLSIDESGKKVQVPRSSTPAITNILETKKPELAIIELGANYVRGYSEATLRNDVARLLSDLRKTGTECVWIGPPQMRRFESELRHWVPLLKSLVEKSCLWIDSRELTAYPASGGDGVHYETPFLRPLAEKWAQDIHRLVLEGKPLR